MILRFVACWASSYRAVVVGFVDATGVVAIVACLPFVVFAVAVEIPYMMRLCRQRSRVDADDWIWIYIALWKHP
jgi:hypothetical protein